jgi:hypothetical protein
VTKSQHKKFLAKLHNLRRDERIAYEMHYKMFPNKKPIRDIKRTSKQLAALAVYQTMSIGLSRGGAE